MILGTLKRLCRNYLAQQGQSHLRDQVLVDAINIACSQWCDRVEYPRAIDQLIPTTGLSYIDVSSKKIHDIEAVYYGGLRLIRLNRSEIDGLTSASLSSSVTTPTGYYYEEVKLSNTPTGTITKRIWVYGSTGVYTVAADQQFEIYYTAGAEEYAAGEQDEAKLMPIPDAYCSDLVFFVAFFHYQRTGDKTSKAQEWTLWQQSQLYARMWTDSFDRDGDKQMQDPMLSRKENYKANY